MDPVNILIVEDDEIVARTIERCLRGEGFRVGLVYSGVESLRAARREVPNLVILDVIMPGMDGYAVCREMRSDPVLAEVPILFLTAEAKDEDKITGLTAGADDFLGKPFNVDELILRIRAILRRTLRSKPTAVQANTNALHISSPDTTLVERNDPAGRIISIGACSLDTQTYEFFSPKSGKIRLTPVQYGLLFHLMKHPSEIFSPARLLDEVWDYPSDVGSPDLVRVHIKNLRERIEDDPRTPKFIKTIAGYGYTIQAEKEQN